MASFKSNSSENSLCGLSFGKKIYFEDGNGNNDGNGGDGGGGGASKATVKKGKAAVVPRPRCQVEGCKVDLTGAKAYYCRHKVCNMHSKSPMVIVAGLQQRFCQQCSRFHQLSEFDLGKRSCRRRLAGHNERRRKPPPVPLSSRYARLSTSLHEDPNAFRSFLVDFSYPRPPGTREIWPNIHGREHMPNHECYGDLNVLSTGIVAHGAHPCILPPVEGLVGVSDSSCALSLLSNQPWGNNNSNTTRNTSVNMVMGSSNESSPVAQDVISSNNCIANTWGGFRGHGICCNAHDMQHEIGISHLAGAENVYCSGGLELALQGNRICNHSCHVMHWCL